MICETYAFGQSQCSNDHSLINVATKKQNHFNNGHLFIHGISCRASRLYDTSVRNTAKTQIFSELEVDTKTREEEERNETVLFGSGP